MIKKVLFILLLTLCFRGLSQEKPITNLSTAPNPFANETTITFNTSSNATVILTVRNILGKTVYEKAYVAKTGINTIPFYKNNLIAGMYLYSIQNEKILISKRFVIQ
jgi:hypothetical protein